MILWSHGLAGAKGRRERSWWAPRGALCLAVAIYPRIERRWWGWYSLAVGVAIAQVLREWNAPVTIRWINDILLGEKKVAGVLTETWRIGDEEYMVHGIGVNVNVSDFPPGLEATSLLETTGGPWPMAPLAAHLCARLGAVFGALERWETECIRSAVEGTEVENPIRRAWLLLNSTLGRRIVYGRDIEARIDLEGRAVGIDDQGAIIVRASSGGTLHLNWGELRHLPRR